MPHEIFEIPNDAPHVGAIHVHYKNLSKEYKVTGLSLNSDIDEWCVEYIPLYEGAVAPKFNRPLISWQMKATVDGREVERYPFVRMD
jgi:hypothetical protein